MTTQPSSTPILVGIGQWSERLGESTYEGLTPVDLAARAVSVALEDAGITPSADAVDVLACARQFDESFPGHARAARPLRQLPALGRGPPRPGPAAVIYEVSGGQSPQHLVTEVAGDIAAGRTRVAVVAGSEAISTVLDLASPAGGREARPHREPRRPGRRPRRRPRGHRVALPGRPRAGRRARRSTPSSRTPAAPASA